MERVEAKYGLIEFSNKIHGVLKWIYEYEKSLLMTNNDGAASFN